MLSLPTQTQQRNNRCRENKLEFGPRVPRHCASPPHASRDRPGPRRPKRQQISDRPCGLCRGPSRSPALAMGDAWPSPGRNGNLREYGVHKFCPPRSAAFCLFPDRQPCSRVGLQTDPRAPPLLRFCLSFQNTPGIPSSCGDLRLAQRAPPASSEGSLEDLSGRAEGRHRVSRVLVVFCRGPFVLIESGPVLRPGKRDRKSPGGCVHRLSVDTPSRGFSVPFSGPCFGTAEPQVGPVLFEGPRG